MQHSNAIALLSIGLFGSGINLTGTGRFNDNSFLALLHGDVLVLTTITAFGIRDIQLFKMFGVSHNLVVPYDEYPKVGKFQQVHVELPICVFRLKIRAIRPLLYSTYHCQRRPSVTQANYNHHHQITVA